MDGRASAKLKLQGGALRTVVTAININTVTAVIKEDQYLTIQALAEALHIPRESIHKILTQELGIMCVVCSVGALHRGS